LKSLPQNAHIFINAFLLGKLELLTDTAQDREQNILFLSFTSPLDLLKILTQFGFEHLKII